MTEAYPIMEELWLTTYRHKTIPPDHTPILSAFCFPHLTSLKLSNFQLLDGAALVPVNFEISLELNYVISKSIFIILFVVFSDRQKVPKAGDPPFGYGCAGCGIFPVKLGTVRLFCYQTSRFSVIFVFFSYLFVLENNH